MVPMAVEDEALYIIMLAVGFHFNEQFGMAENYREPRSYRHFPYRFNMTIYVD